MGVAKLAEAEIAIPTKKGFGSTPNWFAAESAIGKTIAAAALFVITSVKIVVIRQTAASTPTGPSPFPILIVAWAIVSAAPEFCRALLNANENAIVINTSQLMAFVYF